ncbi:MAG: FlgD immunoglobulin-like domain containing protein, partial [Calditrichota bacterium]
ETNSTPVGLSLQLGGTGSIYEEFAWQGASDETPGAVNNGQTFDGVTPPPPPPPPTPDETPVFVNELHYDNVSGDLNEAVEVAGPAGTSINGWSIVLYNGSNGTPYGTIDLFGTFEDQCNGLGTREYFFSGIQNGAPDGLALVDNAGNVVQFLSYEGSFDAVGGPADGMTSEDIGVLETSGTPANFSLQLGGEGMFYEDFSWEAPQMNTMGDCNVNQNTAPPIPPSDCEAFSSAADPVYDNSQWSNGSNDGMGFGPWNLSTSTGDQSQAGHFVSSSTSNGDGDSNADGDIDTAGRSWGLYANSGQLSEALRDLLEPVNAGTEIRTRMDIGFVNPGGTVGIALQNASGENLVELIFIGGDSEFRVVDANGTGPTGVGFTDEGLNTVFTINGGSYDLEITDLSSGAVTVVSGSLSNPSNGQTVAKYRAFNANGGFNPPADLFVNNLEVCQPEVVDEIDPACEIVGVDPGPPVTLSVMLQDFESGLSHVNVLKDKNADVTIPAFTPGTTDAIVVTAVKIDPNKGSSVVLEVFDMAGNSTICDPVYTTLSTIAPQDFQLGQNYPNPFNPTTTIRFGVAAEQASVSLKIYDISGREVRTLINENISAGQYSVEWDGKNNNGSDVAGGVYLYRLTAGAYVQTRQMILVK